MRAAAGQLGFAAFGIPDKPAPAPAPALSVAAQRWLAALLVSLPVGTEHTPLEWGFAVRLLDERYLKKASRFEHHAQRLKGLGFARYDSYDRSKVVSDAPKSKEAKAKDAVSWWYGFVIYWGQVEEHGAKVALPPPALVAKTLRVWIHADAWDALTDEQREDLEEPIGDATVEWEGREGWVTALVSDDEVLVNVRGATEVYQLALHVGDEQPEAPRKPARSKATKPAKAAKVAKAKPHRLTPEPGADELAQRGMHIYAVLIDGDWTRIERRPKELAADWTERARTEAAQDARVRLYDGSPRCVWDSLDGGAP